MERIQYLCDYCGRSKQESNQWWKMVTDGATLLSIVPWHSPHAARLNVDGAKLYHLCGHECAIAKVSVFMGGPQRSHLVAPAQTEVSSTQKESAQAQPQWTPDGPILTEEPK